MLLPVVLAFEIPGVLVPFPPGPPPTAFKLGLPVPAAPLPAGLSEFGDPPPTKPAGGPPPTDPAGAPPPTPALPVPAAPTPAPIAPPRPGCPNSAIRRPPNPPGGHLQRIRPALRRQRRRCPSLPHPLRRQLHHHG